jgi:hypothetical protein
LCGAGRPLWRSSPALSRPPLVRRCRNAAAVCPGGTDIGA